MIQSILRQTLLPLANQELALWQTNYMRNQFPFLGVKVPLLRSAVKKLPSSDWRAESLALMGESEREFHLAAVYHAIHHRKKALPEDLEFYKKLILTHSWWDTVDTIAPQLVGELLHRHPELIPSVEAWLNSSELWLKRTALIYPLFKRKEIDIERLFRSCAKMGKEKDFFIRKAIGWMLRELGKREPTSIARFLETTPLSPLSVREARKYL